MGQPATPSNVEAFLTGITKQVETVPIASHPATPSTRPQKKTTATSSLRRSRRIANAGGRGPAIEKAQEVLMRKLGILTERETVTAEAREAYAKLFDNPLSRPQLAALAALFGWEIPADGEARSAELLS